MVTWTPCHYSNREIEKAILREAAGCAAEDDKNQVFGLDAPDVLLILQALAKRLLGLFGEDLGTSPMNQMRGKKRDFDQERAKLDRADPAYETMLAELRDAEEEAKAIDARYNPDAWRAVLELEGRLRCRAKALERVGLVQTDVDDLAPPQAAEKYASEGFSPKIPLVGTVRITEKGMAFLARGATLRRARKQPRGADVLTEDVEVVG